MDSTLHTAYTADVYGAQDEDIALPESENYLDGTDVRRSDPWR